MFISQITDGVRLMSKMQASSLEGKAEKLDSLLTLISHVLEKDGETIEPEEIKNCINIAWDINYDILAGLGEMARDD